MKEAVVEIRSTDPPAPGEVHVSLRYGGSPPLLVGVSLVRQWEAQVAVTQEEAARLLEALRRAVGPACEGQGPTTGQAATLALRDAQDGEEAHMSIVCREASVVIGLTRGSGVHAERREVVAARELVRALAYQLETALQWMRRYRPTG